MNKSKEMEGFDSVDFRSKVLSYRDAIEAEKKMVLLLKKHNVFDNRLNPEENHGEMRANIMLAYRHLEDARMRLGKAIQHLEGGVSVYDERVHHNNK